MNQKLETLLYGMQFRKLLEQELTPLQKKYSLRRIDMQILWYLHTAAERNTPGDINNISMFTKGHVSQSLGRMQKMHLIKIVRDEEDRRCVHVFLCRDAEEIMENVKRVYDTVNQIVFAGITEEEKQVLLSVAKKINQNIKNVIAY